MNFWWLLVGASYLAGSVPTALIVGWISGHDPTKEGSGNPGATNIYRVAGYKAGAIVLAGDVLKGSIPTLIALLGTESNVALACGAAAVGGHIFPLFAKFRGGKGVATYGGSLIVLFPVIGGLTLALWILVIAAFRISSLASLAGLTFATVAIVLIESPVYEIAVMSAIAGVICLRHLGNIRRLVTGKEKSLKNKPPSE